VCFDPISLSILGTTLTITAKGAAIAAATAASAIAAPLASASANNRYQRQTAEARNRQIEANAEIANKSFLNKASLANLRLQEEAEASSLQLMREDLEDRQAQASTLAQAAETGVRGLSLKSLLAGYDRNMANRNYIVNRNLDLKEQQIGRELEGYRAETMGQINSVQPYVPQYQSAGVAGLQGLSNGINTGLSVYGSLSSLTSKSASKPKKV